MFPFSVIDYIFRKRPNQTEKQETTESMCVVKIFFGTIILSYEGIHTVISFSRGLYRILADLRISIALLTCTSRYQFMVTLRYQSVYLFFFAPHPLQRHV